MKERMRHQMIYLATETFRIIMPGKWLRKKKTTFSIEWNLCRVPQVLHLSATCLPMSFFADRKEI
jgi:hypothetical protein